MNNCISGITYTTEGEISGKMAGMEIATIGRCPSRHRRARIDSGEGNHFSTRIGNRQRSFKQCREKPVALDGRNSAQISCKACKCCPPLSARVPAMMKTTSNQRLPAEVKKPVVSLAACVPAEFNFDQRLIHVGRHRRHTAAMKGMAERKVVRKAHRPASENR
jgi:hypothetical protein